MQPQSAPQRFHRRVRPGPDELTALRFAFCEQVAQFQLSRRRPLRQNARMLKTLVLALTLWGMFLPSVSAEMVVTDLLAYDCRQTGADQLHCDYHWHRDGVDDQITATVGGHALSPPQSNAFPDDAKTSVLFLVDTSDPRREPVVDAIRRQLKTIVAAASPNWRLGLAVFDTNLRVLAPLGSSPEEILAKAQDMKAVGMTTELYRNTLDALRLLTEDQAQRSVLYLFSDGLAEDFAYHHQDVIAKARAADIPIISVGYARTVALSVGLQTLRKLSEDSGGRFVEARVGEFTLPEAFLKQPFQLLESERQLDVDLSPAVEAGLSGRQDVTIQLGADGRETEMRSVVKLPEPPPAPVVEAPPSPPAKPAAATDETAAPGTPAVPAATAAQPMVEPAPPAAKPPHTRIGLDTWLWYGTPAAFLLAVLVALVVYGRLARRRDAALVPASVSANKPYAYLIQQGEEPTRHVIAQSPWRIGRGHNNELVIDDHSVSRQHAEIHRRRDGKFEILDMESMNGVFINDKKVRQGTLNEGDTIDIGDVNFKFTRFEDEEAAQERTVMIRTRTP
jgi:hypothetical protein